jgi:hypothetical protein
MPAGARCLHREPSFGERGDRELAEDDAAPHTGCGAGVHGAGVAAVLDTTLKLSDKENPTPSLPTPPPTSLSPTSNSPDDGWGARSREECAA